MSGGIIEAKACQVKRTKNRHIIGTTFHFQKIKSRIDGRFQDLRLLLNFTQNDILSLISRQTQVFDKKSIIQKNAKVGLK
jgi:hypothetical protein